MSAAKHTPGPWVEHPRDGIPAVGIDVGDGGPLLPIVDLVSGRTKAEARRNRRLIAAAPDTAAKALAFTYTVERYFRGGDGSDPRVPATESEVAEAMYELRAHIAKATGSAA